MTINERFETIIKVLFAGNKRAFANAVGISPTVVENVVGVRRGKPSFDVLEKVCANANISAEWLLLGNGELAMDMFNIRKDLALTTDDENGNPAITTVFSKGGGHIPQNSKDDSPEYDATTAPQGVPIDVLNELLDRITEQAAEIGQLRERIAQLQREKGKDVSDAPTSGIANVG